MTSSRSPPLLVTPPSSRWWLEVHWRTTAKWPKGDQHFVVDALGRIRGSRHSRSPSSRFPNCTPNGTTAPGRTTRTGPRPRVRSKPSSWQPSPTDAHQGEDSAIYDQGSATFTHSTECNTPVTPAVPTVSTAGYCKGPDERSPSRRPRGVEVPYEAARETT